MLSEQYLEGRNSPTSVKQAIEMTKRAAGGFDCEFVEPPPKLIIADCPICLHILREPFQATCCGKNFCKTCLDENKANHSSSCPCCKARNFTSFEDKRLQQILYDFRVFCPHRQKGCQWTGELRALEGHLDTDPPPEKCLEGCSFITISCPLSFAGCLAKLPRCEMRSHLAQTAVTHMLMLAGRQKQLESENRRLRNELDERTDQIEELESDTAYLRNEKEEMEWNLNRLERKLEDIEAKVKDLMEVQQLALHSGLPIGTADITMHNFEHIKQNDGSWCSPPFRTHPLGYQMCLRVDANGWNDGKGTHISVHIYLMRGPFDEHLKWPFLGEITVQLLGGDNRSHSVTISFTDTTPTTYSNRVTASEMASNGWGYSRFISHDELYTHNYLIDDCLQFRISKIELK